MPTGNDNLSTFAQQVLVVVGILVLVVLVLAFLWYAVDVLLLIFAGVLVAILLRSVSQMLSRVIPVPERWCLTAEVVVISGGIVFGFWLLGPVLMDQLNESVDLLTRAVRQLLDQIQQSEWSQQLAPLVPTLRTLPEYEILGQIRGVFSTTLDALVQTAVVLFVGLYLAFEPYLYIDGAVALIPIRYRTRAREVLDVVGRKLQWWLLGRIMAMVLIGMFVTGGLLLLGIPRAWILGAVAAVLEFIPYLGPILSAVPAVLIAVGTLGPAHAVYVVLLYVAVQFLESFLVTPLIQERTISFPPALTIAVQVILGLVAGVLGVALATPLMAVVIVLIQMLYIEDVLGDQVDIVGGEGAPS